MRTITALKHDDTTGLNGSGKVRFEGEQKRGRGVQRIGVDVDPKVIVDLARFLQGQDSPGHAVWHLQNPDTPFPCSTCAKAA